MSTHSTAPTKTLVPKKIALVLSGCGNPDGSEITEAVSCILALSQLGVDLSFFAPAHQMLEAAKITRGKINDLKSLSSQDFDALIFPGGGGVTTQLSNWKEKKASFVLNAEVERVIMEFYNSSKPIGAICIAPILIAKTLGKESVSLTLGMDKEVSQILKSTGAQFEPCPADDYITDRACKCVTTPAYMIDSATPAQVFKGISGMVREIFEMA